MSRDMVQSGDGATGSPGSNLRQTRLARGWTQQQLAAAADLALPTVVRAENDRSEPTVATWQAIARALEVPLGELIPEVQAS